MTFLEGEYFCFDDVLLVPQYSEIESRDGKEAITEKCCVDISTKLATLTLSVPIISANMDSITEKVMAQSMWEAGGLGILHRFMDYDKLFDIIYDLKVLNIPTVPSFGVSNEDRERAEDMAIRCTDGNLNIPMVCLDIAHGHSKKAIEMVKFLKELGFYVIAGNVATARGAEVLVKAGADVIKCGIGPGSLCTTRLVTGHGIPQLSAIIDVCNIKKYYEVQVIADGGIKTSGCIVKALAAGADAVMCGRIFAGCEETPGEIIQGKKIYRGMASYDAQMDYAGRVHNEVPEGGACFVEAKGSVKNIVKYLAGGIRSGLSYSGCNSIKELQENATFVKVSKNTVKENGISG